MNVVEESSGPAIERDVWLFAYGSLMWHPGFDYLEVRSARLAGYHRRFCLYSYAYRGTPEAPGLVLALDRGGSCWGRVYRIAAAKAEAVLRAVDERELLHNVYRRHSVPISLGVDGNDRRHAFAYVVNRASPQYAGRLAPDRIVELIRQGFGQRGTCLDYLRNTVRHLDELGLADPHLVALLKAAEAAPAQTHLE